MKPEHDALFKLGIAERIQLVEDLWDSIARDKATTGVPEMVKQELHRRKASFEREQLAPPLTQDELSASSKYLNSLPLANRFRLMFGQPPLSEKPGNRTSR